MKTILCYGDSNTFGYIPAGGGARYPREVRWTALLQKALGDRAEVISEGLPGRTTVYDRIDAPWKNGLPYLRPCLRSHEPLDMVVFMLGTNDCNIELGITAQESAAGLETLLTLAEEETLGRQGYIPQFVIIVPAAIRTAMEDGKCVYKIDKSSVEKSRALAPLYRQLAEKHRCLFLDGTDRFEVSEVDCEHLTEKGHRQLAEALYGLIKDIV